MPRGIELISVATATDPAQANYPPSKWLENEGWTVPCWSTTRDRQPVAPTA